LLPDTKAEIAVPIMSVDKVWGVLDVQHNVTDGLSQADVDLLQSIANQVAVALRNANLYEEAQQQAKREALMNEINQKIANTKDVQEAMQVAAREIGRALNAAQTIVRFTDDSDSGKPFGDTKPLNGANGQQK
jgi:GAF domain-containing protein